MWTEDWGTLLLQTLETPSSSKALPASSSGKTYLEEADCSKNTGHCSARRQCAEFQVTSSALLRHGLSQTEIPDVGVDVVSKSV